MKSSIIQKKCVSSASAIGTGARMGLQHRVRETLHYLLYDGGELLIIGLAVCKKPSWHRKVVRPNSKNLLAAPIYLENHYCSSVTPGPLENIRS